MFSTQSGLECHLRGMKNSINTMNDTICLGFCLEYSQIKRFQGCYVKYFEIIRPLAWPQEDCILFVFVYLYYAFFQRDLRWFAMKDKC